MLRLMRTHAQSWLIKFVLGIIVVVFTFWGVGSYKDEAANQVGTVNGAKVTYDDYKRTYDNLYNELKRTFGDTLTPATLKMFSLEEQSINRLVEGKLLLQAAQEIGFKVSEKQLAESISSFKAFYRDDKFDSDLYKRVLSQNRLTPEIFEASQTESMLMERMRAFIIGNVKVSDEEAFEWFKHSDSTVNLEYVQFKSEDAGDITVTDEEIEKYYDDHKSAYKSEPVVKALYLVFSFENYKKKLTVTDTEVREYYDDNIDTYTTAEKEVTARHILFKVEDEKDEELSAKAKKKALEVLKLARAGENFGKLAMQYSEGPSKSTGGSLGSFKKAQMVKPFADAAFSMKAGDISEPVKTRFGWHLIMVEKVSEAGTTPYENVADKIKKMIVETKAKSDAFDDAEEVYLESSDGESLRDIADAKKIEVFETTRFNMSGPANLVKKNEFAEIAFKQSVMDVSDVTDLADGYYLIQTIEKVDPEILPLEKVKDKATEDCTDLKKEQHTEKQAAEFLASMKKGEITDKELKTTGFFKRYGAIPGIGYAQTLTSAAFELTESSPYVAEPVREASGYFAIKLVGKKAPIRDEFEKVKQRVVGEVMKQKTSAIYNSWMAATRAKAEIVIKEGFLPKSNL